MLLKFFIFILISSGMYLGIAGILILFSAPMKPAEDQKGLKFNELLLDYSDIPDLKAFPARDGVYLSYRYYPARSKNVLIMLHGSGWHGRYFLPLSEFLASSGAAHVYTPDLRGHGPQTDQRGDVDYMDQLVDDLADFLDVVQQAHPGAKIIIGGHSSGGGLAVRFAGSLYGKRAHAYLLLSPFLKYNAPTMRKNSGGWARPYTPRIIGLTMLNNMGIHWFDYLPAIDFNMPQAYRDGTETPVYSHRLNTAYAPQNYKKDLAAITQPLLVVAGTADDAFIAEQFDPVISQYTRVQVKLLDNVTHMGVVVGEEVRPVIEDWLNQN